MAGQRKGLSYNKLRYFCDPSKFKFKSTKELKPSTEVIGQERAVAAIDLGVKIKNFGYNIFAMGPVGAGRTSTIKEAVENRARKMAVPDDWCYVYNFENADQPLSIRLPAGKGNVFVRSMDNFVAQLKKDIPAVFGSDDFQKRQQSVIDKSHKIQNDRLTKLDQKLRHKGFSLRKIATGLVLVPVKDGQPLTAEQIDALPPDEKKQMENEGLSLQNELNEEMNAIQKLERETKEKLDKHQRQIIWMAIEYPINGIREKFKDHEPVLNYLKAVEEDVINNINQFFHQSVETASGEMLDSDAKNNKENFKRYRVNLIVDNSKTNGAPVVVESNPTYNNLIGRIDRIPLMGTLVTDFTMIKSGSMHKANGGFLIIEANLLFQSPIVWQSLKRSLKNRCIVITDLSEEYSHVSVKTVEPEPIPLDAKVIIIGNYYFYQALLNGDEEFSKLFKIKADFNLEMDLNNKNIMSYARYIARQVELECLLHLDSEAVARVVEYGVEMTQNQEKLSARFTQIRDLLIEANYFAEKTGHEFISKEDIQQALDEKRYRLNKYEVRVQEMINEGTIFIDTVGEKVGMVNGLAVLDLGDYVMGKPNRISVRTYLGQNGVIAIDREVKMSGPLHDKGVLILAGYLNGKFGLNKKISMSASITFEQSYSSIDGDSASSTELYALLSSLSDYPIKQGIAVTGSVNQLGEIQPIGGVKYKVEGFFDVCVAKGLTGKQGVLIPKTNVKNLVLHDRVVNAVKEGKFFIYPVSTVEEGIEILTEKKAGKRGKNGAFPKGTVFRAIEDNLQQMAENLKQDKKKDNDKN